MYCYIALLRGINVGGHKKILMADLKAIFMSLGFSKVTTYIQSGNVVFYTTKNDSDLADIIHQAIEKKYGWHVPVLVKSADEIASILQHCPFSEEKKRSSYFILLHDAPKIEAIQSLDLSAFPEEEAHITPHCVYYATTKSIREAKLSNNFFEKKLQVVATTRNFNTIYKLVSMST